MDFAVDWDHEAIEELARIWMDAPDSDGIADAADFMELHLARQPQRCGKERSEGLRIWQFGP